MQYLFSLFCVIQPLILALRIACYVLKNWFLVQLELEKMYFATVKLILRLNQNTSKNHLVSKD